MKHKIKNHINPQDNNDYLYSQKDIFIFTSKVIPIITLTSIIVIIYYSTNQIASTILCLLISLLAITTSKHVEKNEKNAEHILGPIRLLFLFGLMVVSGKYSPTWLMAIPPTIVIIFTVKLTRLKLSLLALTISIVFLGNHLSGKDFLTNFSTTLGLLFFQYFLFQTINFLSRSSDKLIIEREKSEQLLLNILPASIVNRMKAGETRIADQFDSVSILFTDIVGFTELSENMKAHEVIQLLDHTFSEFDKLTEFYGLQKIKTIGDSYMVVGGMQDPDPKHMVSMADLAIKFHEVIDKVTFDFCGKIKLRVGIHCGEAVAGIIGQHKFAYDIWGDTVNIASRMESHGSPGKIHCTEVVYNKLKDLFHFEERGHVTIKGKGEMKTYYLSKK